MSSGTGLAGLGVTLQLLPTPGSLLVLCHDSASSNSSTVSGGGVTQWTLCQGSLPLQDNSEIWAGFVDGVPSTSIQITLGGSPNDASVVATEWLGFAGPLMCTGTTTSGVGGTVVAPVISGNLTADTGDLVIAMVGTHSTGQIIGAPAGGFTDLGRPLSQPSSVMDASYLIAGSASSVQTQWIMAYPSNWACVSVVFRVPRPEPAQVFGSSGGGSGEDYADLLRIDPASGDCFAAGRTTSFGRGTDALLLRFDGNGVPRATAGWGGVREDEARGLALHTGTTAAGVYVAGISNSFSTAASENDVLLLAYTASGLPRWGARWASAGNLDEGGEAVAVDATGSALVAGHIRLPGRLDDVLLLKFAPVPAGGVPTAAPTVATWGGIGEDRILGSTIDTNGAPRLCVAGSTSSLGNGDHDVLLQKYDTNLNLLWTRTWGGASRDEATDVAVDAQGNLYLVGTTRATPTAPADALVMKWNAQGTLLWHAILGGAREDALASVHVDCGGNVLATGHTTSFGAGLEDGLAVKLDAAGNLVWAYTWGGAGPEQFGGVAVAGCGDLLLTAASIGNTGLAPLPVLPVQLSTSTALVTSPLVAVGQVPAGSMTLPSTPPPSVPAAEHGRDVWLLRYVGATTSFSPACAAAPTTTGGPVLSFDNYPMLGGTLAIRRTSAAATPLTLLVVGIAGAPLPLQTIGGTVPGAVLCVAPLASLWFPGTSPTVFSLPIPMSPVYSGTAYDVQWIDLPELGNSVVGHVRIGL